MRGEEPRHRAKRSLGQNFLVDRNVQRKIVGALGAGAGDEVLEIGPGQGALTEHLAGSVGSLVLVELDDRLAGALVDRYAGRPDVVVLHGDILRVPYRREVTGMERLRVVGNVPYNITTPILFNLLERPRPALIVLMVQEEVADRIVAPVGTKEYGALSVGVRSVASVERLFRVGRRSFRPVPRVDSAVIRIRPDAPPRLDVEEEARLRRLVRASFQWRRKQLGRILRSHPDLSLTEEACEVVAGSAGVSLRDRPERLSPEEFVALSRALP